jgi:hypothetical protein
MFDSLFLFGTSPPATRDGVPGLALALRVLQDFSVSDRALATAPEATRG